MTDAADAALELLERSYHAPWGSRLATELVEAAATHAEASGDAAMIFRVNNRLVDVGFESGLVDRALAAFGRCLALCDERPDEFHEDRLHWRYKWVVEWAPLFHEVSREQLVGLLEDAERRFERRGQGRHAVAKLRVQLARMLGDAEAIPGYFEVWKTARRDTLSDCHACDLHSEVELLAAMGRTDAALDKARVLVAGSARCSEVPHLTYATALPWLLERERADEAMAWHRRGYRILKGVEDKWIGYLGPHLIALAVLGDLGRAMRIVRESLATAASHPVAFQRLTYLLGVEAVLERLARTDKRTTLALPAKFGGDGAREQHRAADVLLIISGALNALLRSFDTRNGNDSVSRMAEDWRSLHGLSLAVTDDSQPR